MKIEKLILSGSTDGRGKKIAATSSPGDTIHTGPSDPSVIDEIFLWCYNFHTAAVLLTLQWGGTTTGDDDIKQTIEVAAGAILVSPGLILRGNATALIVKAYAGTTNVLTLHGFVNRIRS